MGNARNSHNSSAFICQQRNLPLSLPGVWSKAHKCLQSAIHALANTKGLGKLCPNWFTTKVVRWRRAPSRCKEHWNAQQDSANALRITAAPPEVAAMTLPFLFPPCFDVLPAPTHTVAWGSLWSAANEGFPILKKGEKASYILSCSGEKTVTMIQLITGKYNLC